MQLGSVGRIARAVEHEPPIRQYFSRVAAEYGAPVRVKLRVSKTVDKYAIYPNRAPRNARRAKELAIAALYKSKSEQKCSS